MDTHADYDYEMEPENVDGWSDDSDEIARYRPYVEEHEYGTSGDDNSSVFLEEDEDEDEEDEEESGYEVEMEDEDAATVNDENENSFLDVGTDASMRNNSTQASDGEPDNETNGDTSTGGLAGEPINVEKWPPSRMRNLTVAAILGLEFDSIKEAEDFYEMYGLSRGFSTRMGSKIGSESGYTWRRITCHREGTRQKKWLEKKDRTRTACRETRCGCLARCCVRLDRGTGKFKFSQFDDTHNHTMALQTQLHYLRKARRVTEADSDLATTMRASGIKTSQIFEFMVNQMGGYRYVGFLQKDLYNSENGKDRLRNMIGDAETMMSYMRLRKRQEPGFECYFGLNEESHLSSVIWRDSTCLKDYQRFSDTLAFDSTYKTNRYGKPLVLLVGVNNHRASILFGCALLEDETTETYVWLLTTFLAMMNGLSPKAILTDGDEAMRNAVALVFPLATHRLCTWHVKRNAKQRLRNPALMEEFMKLMHKPMSVGSFEIRWGNLVRSVEEGGAADSVMAWLDTMYRKREMWAECFFIGKFFGMMTSTQRCEGLNRHLKRGLSRISRMFEVPHRVAYALARMREAVFIDDYKTYSSTPVKTKFLEKIEDKLGDKLTDAIYRLTRLQIGMMGKYNIISFKPYPECMTWVVGEYRKPHRGWHIEFIEGTFTCSCGLFESDGIPCCHIFTCMKHADMDELPDSLILPRWCRTSIAAMAGAETTENSNAAEMQFRRCCELNVLATSICSAASSSYDGYSLALRKLSKLKNGVTSLRPAVNEDGPDLEHGVGLNVNPVLDPRAHRSRRAKKAARKRAPPEESVPNKEPSRCSGCGNTGHNVRTCETEDAAIRREAFNRRKAALNCRTHTHNYEEAEVDFNQDSSIEESDVSDYPSSD